MPKSRLNRGVCAAALAAALLSCLAVAPSRADARPNVLLIVTDDQRAEGTLQVMPQTRRVFRRGGTEFTNAVATTPTCCPSRATIMSGLYAHNHGVFHNQGNEAELAQLDMDTLLAHRLGSAGYRTGIVGKYLNGWSMQDAPPDFDRYAISQGPFFQTSWNVDGTQRQISRYSTRFVGAQARRTIADWEAEDGRPWFLYVAPFAPHGTLGPGGVTLEPDPQYADARVGSLPSNPARRETSPSELSDKPPFWRQLVASYSPGPGAPSASETRRGQLRMLLSVDDMVAAIYRRLERGRESRRTLAVFVSDNGLYWGEHGAPPFKDTPYPEAVEVPLLMRWPRAVPSGERDTRIAASVDIAPTVLDAAGIRSGPATDGRSLLDPWIRDQILLEYERTGPVPSWASLYAPDERQHTEYYAPNGQVTFREYYELGSDPWLLDNLLGNADPSDDPELSPFSAALAAARVCSGSTCP